jgi:hypothetical protein
MKLFSIGSLFILLTVAYTVTGKAIPELNKRDETLYDYAYDNTLYDYAYDNTQYDYAYDNTQYDYARDEGKLIGSGGKCKRYSRKMKSLYLGKNEHRKVNFNKNSYVIFCNDKNQFPTIFNLKTSTKVSYNRGRTDNKNYISVLSCPDNKSFETKCQSK